MVDVRESPAKWTELITKYRFDLMLIQLDEPKVPVKQRLADGRAIMFWRPAYMYYLPRREWAVVYWDNGAAAMVRRGAVAPRWLAEHEYRYLRPGDTLNLVEPTLAGQVPLKDLRAEMARYLKNHEAGHETSLNSGVISFMRGMEELCSRKGARCAD